MVTDKLIDFIVNATQAEEKTKQEKKDETARLDPTVPRDLGQFWVTKKGGDLVEPCRKKAEHHRGREKHYTAQLGKAEKNLRKNGVSVEVFDTAAGTYTQFQNTLASGGVTGPQQQFQPRVDQKMLDAVKNGKAKMLEHRAKAEQYEKYARAFAVHPEFTVRLNVEEVTYFGLGD